MSYSYSAERFSYSYSTGCFGCSTVASTGLRPEYEHKHEYEYEYEQEQ